LPLDYPRNLAIVLAAVAVTTRGVVTQKNDRAAAGHGAALVPSAGLEANRGRAALVNVVGKIGTRGGRRAVAGRASARMPVGAERPVSLVVEVGREHRRDGTGLSGQRGARVEAGLSARARGRTEDR
jgi:hypothetical protein